MMSSKGDWLRRDLWSKGEFSLLCLGILPDTVDIPWTDELLIKRNEIEARIDQAVLAGVLRCLDPTDTQDGAHKMYGRARYFKPSEAIGWAFKHFAGFPFKEERLVGNDVKPVQRSTVQDQDVLQAIREAGYSPQALPRNEPGKPGVKAEIRRQLEGKNRLFQKGSTVFNK